MIDQNSQFFALLTKAGEAKQANADALGVPWGFSFMGVGDANGTEPMPDRLQTQLINEQYKAPINQVRVSPSDSSIIITELVIPPEVGGWWIREIGLYDIDGDLVAVANCAPSFKPLLDQGSGKTQIVRMNFVVRSSGNIALKIDPTVVLATRDYVDNAIIEALPRTTVAGTFTQVRVNDRGLVEEGSNPSTLGEYGITDAHTKVETEALIGEAVAPLANKADKADTLAGYGITDAHTKVETEALIGEAVAPLAGKADKADTLAGYGITDAHTKVETEALIGEAVAPLAGKADKADTLAGYGITDAHTKVETEALIGEAVAPLANKADRADTLAGYGITDAHTKMETEALIGEAIAPLAGKADKADTLAGYGIIDTYNKAEVDSLVDKGGPELDSKFDKAGGLISGPVTIKALAAADGDFTPALSITSEEGTPGVSTSFEMRNYEYSTHFLAHATYLMVMLENHASPESWNWQPCPIFAGDVYSNNSLVHTHVTFSKPSASGWIAVNGATTLPNGGVWAYSVSWSGSDSDGASANIVPGGSTIGKEGAVGFAWRIGF